MIMATMEKQEMTREDGETCKGGERWGMKQSAGGWMRGEERERDLKEEDHN